MEKPQYIDWIVEETVTNASELQEAVKMDHVCAEYKKNYRSIDNFIKSNVVVMDLDNDHTDNPDEWITAEKLEELLPDISYAVAPSRNHMVAKNGKAARPKYHVYSEIEEITDSSAHAALKAAIHNAYPFFDGNALDAARFIFGADSGEVVWQEGWTTIDEDIVVEISNEETPSASGPILEGSRNNTMSRFASRVLKKYGVTDKAREAFEIHAYDSIYGVGNEHKWEKRWNISDKLTRNPIVSIPNEIVPTDGKNLRYRQLESIAKSFGIHNAILPRAEIGGNIQEMVDNRNYIAHGNKTPKEVGREVSVNDLQRKLDHISEACAYIIELYEKYIEEQMYLKNH